jgi:hypothetical protein
MSLQVDTIRRIFQNGGSLLGGQAAKGALSKPIVTDEVQKVEGIYWKAKVTVWTTDVKVAVNNVSEGDVNGVKVFYDTSAGVGPIKAPGYIYSDTFSGCVFYLFRGDGDTVYGVHAPRSSGKLFDPTMYFRSLGAKLLYYFDTMGHFTTPGQVSMDTQGRVLACIGNRKITVFFVKCKNNDVEQIVDDKVIDDWRRQEIDPPTLQGAGTTTPQSRNPFKRIKEFFVRNH